jgi:ADP-heptose:LPS heptosyltransferase
VDIPHTHHRSSTSSKVPGQTLGSIMEYNRAKFLCRWSGYLNKEQRILTNKAIIYLTLDGIGDIVDCFYPVESLIKHLLINENNIDIYCSNKKIKFLYNYFKIKYPLVTLLDDEPDIKQYDSVYKTNSINFSYPFHTMDLIAGSLGMSEFDTNEKDILHFVQNLESQQNTDFKNLKYVIVHIDSQRSSFESRAPKPHIFIQSLEDLIQMGYHICLVGQPVDCSKFKKFVQKNKAKIIDARNYSIRDTTILISNAVCFFGIDSGPSHIAQLFNIPSYIIYGPVHPLSKIYRLNNSGCYFKNNEGSGAYHRILQPSYYYDLSKQSDCIKIDPNDLSDKLILFISNNFKFDWSKYYESLRYRQRQISLISLQNPVMEAYNTMKQQNIGIKDYADKFINNHKS